MPCISFDGGLSLADQTIYTLTIQGPFQSSLTVFPLHIFSTGCYLYEVEVNAATTAATNATSSSATATAAFVVQ